MTALIIVIAVVAIIAIYLMTTYNSFVKLRNQAEEAGAGIDVHLKERYDLIPNLVETVKGYAKHESSTLEAVIKARNSAMSASTLEEKDAANNALSGTLKSLFALSESYPDLKANTGFVDLQQKLTEIEKGLLNLVLIFDLLIIVDADMIATLTQQVVWRDLILITLIDIHFRTQAARITLVDAIDIHHHLRVIFTLLIAIFTDFIDNFGSLRLIGIFFDGIGIITCYDAII